MDKKTLRKELEKALISSIEETLNKRNAIAGKQIRKKIEEASKTVAKKFYKAIGQLSDSKPVMPKTIAKKAAPVKKAATKKAVTKPAAKRKK
jgi:ribosomal protein RSM22 (predicted rRNA methylase)